MTPSVALVLRRGSCVFVVLAALGLLWPVVPALGQSTCFDNGPIQNSDPEPTGYFGTGLAAHGNLLAVGASLKTVETVDNVGAAYVFWLESGAWVEKQIITPNVTTSALFGESVAMSGDLLAVAAPPLTVQNLSGAGAVYVYLRDDSLPASIQWQELDQVRLTAGSEIQSGGSFGGPLLGSHQGVAMDDRLLIVGSPGADVGSVAGAGKAYIFLYDPTAEEWSLEDTLQSNNPYAAGQFGQAVAISGTRVIVGEYGRNKAHIFNRNATTHEWEADGVLTHVGDFGWSVAVDGDVAVVGANAANKAYVYKRISGTWEPSGGTALTTDDALGDEFGSCVSISGSLILVGARNSTHPITPDDFVIGAAYLFQRQNVGGQEQWQEVLQIRSGLAPFDDGGCTHGGPDRFGETVLLDGDRGFVGANADEFPEVGTTYGLAGLVYILDNLPAPDECVEAPECP